MNEIKNKTDFGAFIPSFLDDYPLEPEEFRLYAHILRRAGNSGCFESVPKMAGHCRIGKRRTQQALKLLLLTNLITISSRLGKSNVYTLTPMSEWVEASEVPKIRRSIMTQVENDPGRKRPTTKTTQVENDPGRKRPTTQVEKDPGTQVEFDLPPRSNSNHEGINNKGIPVKEIPSKGIPLNTPLTPQGENERAGVKTVDVEVVEKEEEIKDPSTNTCFAEKNNLAIAKQANPSISESVPGGENHSQNQNSWVNARNEYMRTGEVKKPGIDFQLWFMEEMRDVVPLYRKSGWPLTPSKNDISRDFKAHVVTTMPKGSDLSNANNYVVSLEKNPEKWGTLEDLVLTWQAKQALGDRTANIAKKVEQETSKQQLRRRIHEALNEQ